MSNSQSLKNSSSDLLKGSSTYTGDWEFNDFYDVMISVKADVSGTVYMEFSDDEGITVEINPIKGFKVIAGVYQTQTKVKGPRWFRIRYVNDSDDQTTFSLNTYFGTFGISNLPNVDINKALITVFPRNIRSIFGEILTAELSPIIQLQFSYNINDRLVSSLKIGSGTVSVSDSLVTLSTGTTTESDVLFRSIRDAHYPSGQGIRERFTALFQSNGTAGTEVVVGYGNEEDGFFFGYDGSDLGVLHRSGGKLEHQSLTITAGESTSAGNITITLDGTDTTVAISLNDTIQDVVRAIVATDFGVWNTQAFGKSVIFISHMAETKSGAMTFTDTDTTGVTADAFVELTTGTSPTREDWIKQTDWNTDKMDGFGNSGMKLIPENGNVYSIVFGWLGFDNINFFIKEPVSGEFILVHSIEYPNSDVITSIQNPTLPIYISVKNNATTTDIVVKAGSLAIFVEGKRTEDGPSFSASSFKNIGTTETCILVLKNKPVFQGVQNRVDYLPTLLSFSANGTAGVKTTTLRIRHNPILDGNTDYSDIDTNNNTVAVDTASTTVSGGVILGTFVFGKDVINPPLIISADDLKEIMGLHPPGNVMAITVEVDTGTSDINVSINAKSLF